jgi:RNA polymerase-binding transcription factor DksA
MALDQAVIAELKEKLLIEKKRLESELSGFADSTEVPGDYKTAFDNIGTDEDENATEVEEYVDNLALESNLEGQLRDVDDALAKIEQNTYGICEKTGQEISIERLKAYPAARTVV